MLRVLSVWWSLPARVRVCVPLLALAALLVGGAGQPGGTGGASAAGTKPVQSGRVSRNVAVITMEGEIDAVTSVSVRRRIAEAERGGADAIVMEINSPGGELGAVIEITSALRRSSVTRSVAWINPEAHSGGALTALACQEIVVANGSAFGDAAPIWITPLGIKEMKETERAKILSPLLAEVVNSARKNGYDEKLMQGMVTLGVELWLVENPTTHERMFIDRGEYALLFDGEPPTSRPRLIGPGTGSSTPAAGTPAPAAPPAAVSPTDLLPASPQISKETAAEASMGISAASQRRVLTTADKGKWKLVEFVADGKSLFTFGDTDMIDLRVASARVNNEADLKAYMGASSTIVFAPTWYERLAGFMRNFWVRGVLVVIIILGLFIEFIHPGLIVPGSVAAAAALLWLLPELLMGLAGWWELVLIVGGVALIGVELFLLPGIGVAGALGLVSLLTGLVLAFIPAASPTFPGVERSSAGLVWGVGFVLVGITTAVAVGYYMSKNMRTLPVLGRLILTDRPLDEDVDGNGMAPVAAPAAPVVVGTEGVAITSLRPSGKAELDGRVIDVVSDGPVIDAGRSVRVVSSDEFRVVVEAV